MPWTPTQSGNLNPARFFPNLVIVNTAGAAQNLSGAVGSGIFIPFSNLESYKVATSGDIREFIYSVLDKAVSGINTSTEPLAKTSISKSTSFSSDTSAVRTYVATFNMNAAPTTFDVVDE